MLLELLAGNATSLNCSVPGLLTKICGHLQTPWNCMRVTQNRNAVPVGSQSQSDNHSPRGTPRGNCGSKRSDASLVRTDSVLSVRPDSDPRSRPSAPCAIQADTNMVSSEINLDIPLNKTSLLQESHCLNTKIINDKDVQVPEITVKVDEVEIHGVVDFIEARLHQGVDAAHTHTVPGVNPLGAAHQGLCLSQEFVVICLGVSVSWMVPF